MTNQYIVERLKQIERDYRVRILLAVESGSRAWGFESADSDWDVRFIYVHPLEWYLTVEPGKDVIEIMDGDFDASGWDLRKALQLYTKTNPSMLEWLHTNIRYMDDGVLVNKLLELEPEYFNVLRGVYHYYSLAERHNERYLLKNGVTLKRFLYYFRSLLACRWIIDRGTPPPVPFRELVAQTVKEPEILEAVDRLLELKRSSKEHNHDEVESLLIDYALALSTEVKAFLEGDKPRTPACNRTNELDKLLFDMALGTIAHAQSK